MSLHTYLPQDRLRALARNETLPDHTTGTALFADISGFTPLTEKLTRELGPRRGAEALSQQLETIFTALIAEVENYGGSVLGFAGDAMTCWFDETPAGGRPQAATGAVACALALQSVMQALPPLALKVSIATGPAWRGWLGDPAIQLLDTLAGDTLTRMAVGEQLAQQGEVLIDTATAAALKNMVEIAEWRVAAGERFGVVQPFTTVTPAVNPEPLSAEASPLFTAPQFLAALRPYLLPAIYERETAGQGAFLLEFRPAVAVFVRFVGLEAEGALAQLAAAARATQAALDHYGGALLHLSVGDKGCYALGLFGAPLTHEDDARRAVLAAQAIRATVASPVQLGLSAGVIYAGALGGPTRRSYDVLGDEVNLAARLMQAAAPGEILVSARVQAATEKHFVFAPCPPLTLKGIADPVPTFQFVRVAVTPTLPGLEAAPAQPLVGRQAEWQLLLEKLAQAQQGQGQVVGLVAEAGLGKSRLVAEVWQWAQRAGVQCAGGAGLAEAANTPYAGWHTILHTILALDPNQPPTQQAGQLAAAVQHAAPHRAEAAPLLAAVLQLPLAPNDFTRALEPKDRKGALHALILELLRFATRTPWLIVLEDAHWLDTRSLELLEEVARAAPTWAVLVLVAYRPEAPIATRLAPLRHPTTLTLTELTPAAAELLLRQRWQALGAAAPAPALQTQILARAQGNPLYLEELLNYLHQRAAATPQELPESLHALLLSRLDQLTEPARATLKVASIIGRGFRLAWLRGYYPALTPTLAPALATLCQQALVQLETPAPETTYIFRHGLVRDVVYESQTFAARAALHEQLAAYLETVAAEAVDLLAYHYGLSFNTAKQRVYFQQAGEAAAARYAGSEAVYYLSRALELTPATEAATRYTLLLARARMHDLQGDRRAQQHDLTALAALAAAAQQPSWQAQVALQQALLAEQTQQLTTAIESAQHAIALAQTTHQPALAAASERVWGAMLWQQQQPIDALPHLERALQLAHATQQAEVETLALNGLSLVQRSLENRPRAQAYATEALRLCQARHERRGEGWAAINLGILALDAHAWATAQTYLTQALTGLQSIGDRRGEGLALALLSDVALAQQHYAEARTHGEQAYALFQAVGDWRGAASAAETLCETLHALGAPAAAQTYIQHAITLARQNEAPGMVALYLTVWARGERLAGRFATARAALRESLTFTPAPTHRAWLPMVLETLHLGAATGHQLQAQHGWHAARQLPNWDPTFDETLAPVLGHAVAAPHPNLAQILQTLLTHPEGT